MPVAAPAVVGTELQDPEAETEAAVEVELLHLTAVAVLLLAAVAEVLAY